MSPGKKYFNGYYSLLDARKKAGARALRCTLYARRRFIIRARTFLMNRRLSSPAEPPYNTRIAREETPGGRRNLSVRSGQLRARSPALSIWRGRPPTLAFSSNKQRNQAPRQSVTRNRGPLSTLRLPKS